MKRLIIDISSILRACHMVGKDPDGFTVEFEGKDVQVNSSMYAYDNFMQAYHDVLTTYDVKPFQTVIVKDGADSRALRRAIYPEYKAHRKPSPPQVNKMFYEALDEVCKEVKALGGIVTYQNGMEADDVIAYLATRLQGHKIIWSRDQDMLALAHPGVTDVLIKNDLNPPINDCCPPKYVCLYKALCGDASDGFPGAKGFGPKAFESLAVTFGLEGLDSMEELITSYSLQQLQEDVADFKPLQKVIDNAKDVYVSYALARFYPEKVVNLVIETAVGGPTETVIKEGPARSLPAGGELLETFNKELDFEEMYVDPAVPESRLLVARETWERRQYVMSSESAVRYEQFDKYQPEQVLVDANNLEQMWPQIEAEIDEAEWVALDLETDVFPESEEWVQAIKDNVRKDAIAIDAIGSVPVGVSINCGSNHHKTYYFTFEHADAANIDMEAGMKRLIRALQTKQVVCHRATGFELPVIYRNTGLWLPNTHCSKILACYVDENLPTGLKQLSERYLGYAQTTYEEVTQGRGMAELTAEEVLKYGCDDSVVTSALYNRFRFVCEIEGTWDVFKEVEVDAGYLSAKAFAEGFSPDIPAIKELQQADANRYQEAMERIKDILVTYDWPGSRFEPLTDLSPAEVKRGYALVYGKPLKAQVRKIEKLAELCGGTYGELLVEGDIDKINRYINENFRPDPRFNPKSPVDVSRLLYETLGCPVRYYNDLTDKQKEEGRREGNPSTDNDCLQWAAQVDCKGVASELVSLVIECRSILTRNSLYFSKYPWFVHWDTGNIHSNLNQSATTSRRFAPSSPNCNQLPKRSEEGKKVRRVVVPHRPDAVIVAPDFSGQELRVGAWASQDPNFLACYVEGLDQKDLHTLTGWRIYCKRHAQITYDEYVGLINGEDAEAKLCRNDGKKTNFLSQYLGGSWTLSKQLVVSEETAQMFLDAREEALSAYSAWAETEQNNIRLRGYATTFLGARKHVRDLLESSYDANHVLRSALNFIVQSSSAEMTKLVMGRVWREGLLDRYQARFYFAVHDELVFSVPKENLTAFCYDLKPMMLQQYADMGIPIESDLSVGPNFCDLKSVPWPNSVEEVLV